MDLQLGEHQRKTMTVLQKVFSNPQYSERNSKIKRSHLSWYNPVFLPAAPTTEFWQKHLHSLCTHDVPDDLPNRLPWKPQTQSLLRALGRIPSLPALSKQCPILTAFSSCQKATWLMEWVATLLSSTGITALS